MNNNQNNNIKDQLNIYQARLKELTEQAEDITFKTDGAELVSPTYVRGAASKNANAPAVNYLNSKIPVSSNNTPCCSHNSYDNSIAYKAPVATTHTKKSGERFVMPILVCCIVITLVVLSLINISIANQHAHNAHMLMQQDIQAEYSDALERMQMTQMQLDNGELVYCYDTATQMQGDRAIVNSLKKYLV